MFSPTAVSRADERMTVAFESFPPYEYMKDGVAVGANVEVIREACRRMDVTPHFMQLPWRRALLELREGGVDVLSSGFRTMEREVYTLYPKHPLARERVVVVGRSGEGVRVGSLNDLRGLRVGVVRQHSYGQEFDSMRGLDKDYSTDVVAQLRKLSRGRTDVALVNLRVFGSQSERHAIEGLEVLYTIGRTELFAMFSRAGGSRVRSLWERFDQVLGEMWADGSVSAIHERYGLGN